MPEIFGKGARMASKHKEGKKTFRLLIKMAKCSNMSWLMLAPPWLAKTTS